MLAIEPNSKKFNRSSWKPTAWPSYLKNLPYSGLFPLPLWEIWFCSSLGAPVRTFNYDSIGDDLQTCTTHSDAKVVHDWVVVTETCIFIMGLFLI
jgi:hypothetical protein